MTRAGRSVARHIVMRVDAQGWIPTLRQLRSPHADARPAPGLVDLLLIHHISLPPGTFAGDAIERLFLGTLDPHAHPAFAVLEGVRVSAHFLIRRDGRTTQFVSCADRAWHAGASHFLGRERCNDFSLGVELEGTGDIPYTARQYASLGRLLRCLCGAYPLAWIAGHSDVAPGRKVDPGPSFDWDRLAPQLLELGLQRPF